MYRAALTLVAAVALGLGVNQNAGAADLPAKAFSPAHVAPLFSWTGCYVGVHVGAGLSISSFTSEREASGIGAVGGGQIGCNYQIRQFVIGVEGEVWGSTLYDRDAGSSGTPGISSFSRERNSYNRWDAAISVRSGVAFDRAFIYGKLGVVWGEFDYNEDVVSTQIGVSTSTATQSGTATHLGVLIGVGFEYALTDNWTTKFEYNYIDYGNQLVDFTRVNCQTGVACSTSTFSDTIKERKQLAKVGLNYKF